MARSSGIALARLGAPVFARHRWAVAGIGSCILIAGLFQFVPPLLMGRFLGILIVSSHGGDPNAYRELSWLFTAIAASVVTILIFQYAANRCGVWLATNVTIDVRTRLHRAVLDSSFAATRGLDAGTLQTRIVADTASIESLFSVALPTIAIQTIFVSGAIALLLSRAPFLAPVVAVPVVVLAGAVLLARRVTRDSIAESAKLAGALSSRVAELGNGSRAIALSGRAPYQQRIFETIARGVAGAQRRVWNLTGGFQHALILNVSLCSYLLWYVGGLNAVRPDASLAVNDLIALVPIVLLLFQPIYSLAATLDTVPKALAAAERIAAVLDLPPERRDGCGAVPTGGTLHFERVWFGYDDGTRVLRECSFTIEPGEFVALTGVSGAGKSTIVNLIARLYEPDSGSLRWGASLARDVDPASWRRAIGVVAQDTFVFAESVRENVRCGREWIDDAAIEAAASVARIDEFVRAMKDGFDSVLGDGGLTLSGGERQRLGIARALAGDPLLLLLDEPSASLDPQTEGAFLDALERARRGRSVLMVAHRSSAVARADRALLLKDGRIAKTARGAQDAMLKNSR